MRDQISATTTAALAAASAAADKAWADSIGESRSDQHKASRNAWNREIRRTFKRADLPVPAALLD